MTDTSKEFLAALSKGLRSGNAYMTNREQADFIEALGAQLAAATERAEQAWCGTWWECRDPRCTNAALDPSPELVLSTPRASAQGGGR